MCGIEWKDKKNWTTLLTAQYIVPRDTRMTKICKCPLIPFFHINLISIYCTFFKENLFNEKQAKPRSRKTFLKFFAHTPP